MASSEAGSSSSTSAFVTTLIFNGLIALLFVFLFLTLRPRYHRYYQPRSLSDIKTIRPSERTEEVPPGYFAWVPYLMEKPHSFLIQHTSVDGYFYIRFLPIFGALSLLGCLILFPILLPVNAAKGNRLSGFERLSFANVGNKHRFFAHVFLSWLYFGLVIYTIYRELYYYISMRHALQTSPYYASQIGSRTVILTAFNVHGSKSVRDVEEAVRGSFEGVEVVTCPRDQEELQQLVKERKKLAQKYEKTLNKVVNKSVKVRRKAEFKEKLEELPSSLTDDDFEKYVKRPSHTLGKIPCVGEKVDSLKYYPRSIGELNNKIKNLQTNWAQGTPLGTCFIIFDNQYNAQKAYQSAPAVLAPGSFDQRLIGYAPEDICWDNLSLGKATRHSKRTIGNAILTAMIIFWAIPVAVVGCISNINFLTDKVHFLRFINNMPSKLMGIITGLLPSVALAILMSLVPIFIRKVGHIGGAITRQERGLYCQRWYYAFQVVQVFLVTTLASSASSTVTAIINKPSDAMVLLSNNLPKASNFYITYFLLLGLLFPSGALLQVVAFIVTTIKVKWLGSTPRQKWNYYNRLTTPSWDTIYPIAELMVCIYLCYALISPILLIFSSIAFFLFYLAYVYNLNYVYGFSYDMKGRNFVRALFQVFLGLYLAEVCLLGLFIMAKSVGPIVLSVFTIVGTALSHMYFKRRFLPLVDAVPLSVLSHSRNEGGFVYPSKDQGLEEVKELGENSSATDFITTAGNAIFPSGPVEQKTSSDPEQNLDDHTNPFVKSPTLKGQGSSLLNVFKNFFNPSTTYSYLLVKQRIPQSYNEPVQYEAGYEEKAYTDPSVTDSEPIIWVANDPMGVATKQATLASQTGVNVSVEGTGYNDKGKSMYTANPPDYDINEKI